MIDYNTLDGTIDALNDFRDKINDFILHKMDRSILERDGESDWEPIEESFRQLLTEIDETIQVCKTNGSSMKVIADKFND